MLDKLIQEGEQLEGLFFLNGYGIQEIPEKEFYNWTGKCTHFLATEYPGSEISRKFSRDADISNATYATTYYKLLGYLKAIKED